MKPFIVSMCAALLGCGFCMPALSQEGESLAELGARLGRESQSAYEQSRFSRLSRNYFNRFSRDPEARPGESEMVMNGKWAIRVDTKASKLTVAMANALGEFLRDRLGVAAGVEAAPLNEAGVFGERTCVLIETGGGDPDTPESFSIDVRDGVVLIAGRDAPGLRDGVTKLVEQIGMRQAPILPVGKQTYKPRLRVRLGTTPWMGSQRDLVFMGFNAVFTSGGELYALSESDAIPELEARRQPGSLESLAKSVQEAQEWGLRTYCFLSTRSKFDKDDPMFARDPGLRGALTWTADGQYVLCTEHPDVRRFLTESVEGIFRAAPDLDGCTLIIGGEGFYHCFMRAHGVAKGHTNCPRCEPLGAETVVANLCNRLADAARRVNPNAEIIAWPYSAEHVWSADKAQTQFIARLKPGTGIFTEIEKDEYVEKPQGVRKHLWDYSIDLIGPGERARQQVAACRAAGIPIYMKSEPELGFEAPRLSHIPCMDRWWDRADALASCGADGAWVFPAFRPCYGTTPAESYRLAWWDPMPDKEDTLRSLAARVAGREAGPRLRAAWRLVSDAIAFSPELPSYYTGPYYLGPAHPMCADPDAELPPVFFGQYLFLAEMTDKEGLPRRPTFVKSPTGNVPIFGQMYREMESILKKAVDEIDAAAPLVPERCRLTFDSEASAVRWFYHTARAEANFYESCQIRDALLALAGKNERTTEEIAAARNQYGRWLEVLADEKANAEAALPVVEADMRLDWYYGGDHTFPHGADMIKAKLELIQHEMAVVLPELAKRCGL